MKRTEIEIVSRDRSLVYEIVGNSSVSEGMVFEVPGGTLMSYQSSLLAKSMGVPEVLTFIIDASVAININLLAAYLYEKVKDNRVEKITIRRKVVTEITEAGIRQVLEEVCTQKRR